MAINRKLNKLEAMVVKMGLSAGDDEGTLKKDVEKFQTAVQSWSPVELNEFITGLFNKVFKTHLFKRIIFNHPIFSLFIEEGTSFEAYREFIDVQLTESKDYDPNLRVFKQDEVTKTLSVVISTRLRKFVPMTLQLTYSRAAFANPTAFTEWVNRNFEVITESINIELYRYVSKEIAESIKNEIDLSSIAQYDKLLEQINILSDNMTFPSKAYNMGYQSKGTGINRIADEQYDDKTRTNATPRSDMILVMSPRMKNLFDSRVGSIKFHNQYFDVAKYKTIVIEQDLLIKDGKEYMLLIDKKAFKGYFRLNEMHSNFWAPNLKTDYAQHYWLVFGGIPWANGVKIKLNDKIVSGEYKTLELKQGE